MVGSPPVSVDDLETEKTQLGEALAQVVAELEAVTIELKIQEELFASVSRQVVAESS